MPARDRVAATGLLVQNSVMMTKSRRLKRASLPLILVTATVWVAESTKFVAIGSYQEATFEFTFDAWVLTNDTTLFLIESSLVDVLFVSADAF
ncbi:hypothetical protein Y032_0033g2715 [Ancylostoma ceylanicum]|uniref:Uncharacterized protein n=1 Tax=Ancylostoma ceylanicum TaxID=53326 RepID=A0A016UNX3_9BILA|nr:hypothetical protein Y032_0033g2715 [Ancylostoma ceylanicum]